MQNACILHAVNPSIMYIWVSTQTYINKLYVCQNHTLHYKYPKNVWSNIALRPTPEHHVPCNYNKVFSFKMIFDWRMSSSWMCLHHTSQGRCFFCHRVLKSNWRLTNCKAFLILMSGEHYHDIDVTLRARTVLYNQQNHDHCCVIKCVFLRESRDVQ